MERMPELTREEYMRLLYAAKRLGQERIYFIIKAMCGIGIKIGELPQFTVEMLHSGGGELCLKGTRRMVQIPAVLQRELLEYAARNDIRTGTVFVTRTGQPMGRTNICIAVKSLAPYAEVAEEKCNPRCLWKLYKKTRKEMEEHIAGLLEQVYEQLLCAEQTANAWESQAENEVRTIGLKG